MEGEILDRFPLILRSLSLEHAEPIVDPFFRQPLAALRRKHVGACRGMGGRSMPRVGLRWSSPFSSIRKWAKLLMVDFTRVRWLTLNPSCSRCVRYSSTVVFVNCAG